MDFQPVESSICIKGLNGSHCSMVLHWDFDTTFQKRRMCLHPPHWPQEPGMGRPACAAVPLSELMQETKLKRACLKTVFLLAITGIVRTFPQGVLRRDMRHAQGYGFCLCVMCMWLREFLLQVCENINSVNVSGICLTQQIMILHTQRWSVIILTVCQTGLAFSTHTYPPPNTTSNYHIKLKRSHRDQSLVLQTSFNKSNIWIFFN